MSIGTHFEEDEESDKPLWGRNLLDQDKLPDHQTPHDCSKEITKSRIEENESILKMAELYMDARAILVIKTRISELKKKL